MKQITDDLPELELMRQGVQYKFSLKIRNWSVPVRPVTVGEHMSINNEVINDMAGLSPLMRSTLNESYMLAKSMLKKASAEPPPSTRLGPITDLLLDSMTIDEVLFLYTQYEAGVAKVNPKFELLSNDDVQELISKVKKKESALTDCSFSQLVSMVHSLLLS